MSKLRLATDLDMINNIQLLALSSKFELVSKPEASFINGKVITNFDFYLDIGLRGSDDLKILLGDKYIDFKRHGKREQMVHLEMAALNTAPTTFPIRFPGEVKVDHNRLVGLSIGLGNVPNDKLVIKIGNGARGMGQAVVSSKDFVKFSKHYLNGTVRDADFNDKSIKWGGADSDREEPLMLRGLSSSHDLLISKKVPMKSEYRMLFSHDGNCIVVKRVLEAQGGWQARGGDGDIVFEGPITSLRPSHLNYSSDKDVKEFTSAVLTLIKNIGYSFGSLDFYIGDTNGKSHIGVFEYCPQFAYTAIDGSVVRQLIENGLTSRLVKNV